MRDGKDPHHIIQSFSWGQCKLCTLQHICKSSVLHIFKSPQRWSCSIVSIRGYSTVSFIWLSGKGFCSHVLSCSKKWLYKRESCDSTCVFPGYLNCIYLFQCFRHICTTPIPVTSAEQVQFRGKELASISCSTGSVELVSQSMLLQWCNYTDENRTTQLFLKGHFRSLGLKYMWLSFLKEELQKESIAPLWRNNQAPFDF